MLFTDVLKSTAQKVWEDGYTHPFVQELGKGSLAKEKFKFYLLQDYLYLLEYAKVFALGVLKAKNEETMALLTATQHSIFSTELNIHRQYMGDFDITSEQVLSAKPSLFNRTYTANMLAVGQAGSLEEIIAAVLPCAWTYSDYAKRLKKQYEASLENNFYKSWVESYANPDFDKTFSWMFDLLNEAGKNKPEAEKERIKDIFASSVEFEYLFWDMAYKQQMSYTTTQAAL